MLINEQPRFERSWYLTLFQVLSILLLRTPIKSAGRGVTQFLAEEAKKGIHGKTAVPLSEAGTALGLTQDVVGGAFVSSHRARNISAENAVGYPGEIRVAAVLHTGAGAPGHNIVHPVIQPVACDRGDGGANAVVVGYPVVVIG